MPSKIKGHILSHSLDFQGVSGQQTPPKLAVSPKGSGIPARHHWQLQIKSSSHYSPLPLCSGVTFCGFVHLKWMCGSVWRFWNGHICVSHMHLNTHSHQACWNDQIPRTLACSHRWPGQSHLSPFTSLLGCRRPLDEVGLPTQGMDRRPKQVPMGSRLWGLP